MLEAQILHMPLKVKLVCSACAAPGEGSCQCGVGYFNPSAQKEQRKALAGKLYAEGATMEEIAVKLWVSRETITKDLAGLVINTKPHRPKGGRPKGSTAPQRDKVRQVIADCIAAGEPVPRKKLAEQHGVGENSVQLVAAQEQAKQELLDELAIDPKDLSLTAQAKLEIAKRQVERKLNAEHMTRTRELDEEVRQRVLSEGKEYLAMLKTREEEADKLIATYKEFINNHKPLFTIDQFNLLRKCLHQRGIAASSADFDAAFNLIQTRKLQLTGEK